MSAQPTLRTGFPGTPTPRLLPWIVGGTALALMAALLGTYASGIEAVRIFFDENGPIELTQAACLAVTAVIFAAAFLKSTGSRALFCVIAFGAIVTATTRETPRCGSDFYESGMCLTHAGKDGIVIAGAVVCVLALLWRPLDWRKVLHPVSLRWVWPSFVVIALLAGAELAEHAVMMTLEESLELSAYLYLAAFALWFHYYSVERATFGPVAESAAPARLR